MPEKGNVSYTDEEKRKKVMKWVVYITAFVIFQTAVILVFALVVMKVRAPKFRIGDLEITNLTTSTNSATPAFDIKALAPITVKNKNFGPYKFDATTVNFTYGGVAVGQAVVPKGKAGWFMSTKKVNVDVELNSAKLAASKFSTELSAGFLTVQSAGTLNGKIVTSWILKKKKSVNMNCTIVINVSGKSVQSVTCK